MLDAPPSGTFVALDFETADRLPDSACAVALVRVEQWRIVGAQARLIRPPRQRFEFSYVHGLHWRDVCGEPTFAAVWPDLVPLLEGAHFIAAHNASFDERVLGACCLRAGVAAPPHPFRCTVRMARTAWKLFPTKLPDVCRFLGLTLRHHDALSDARACAAIAIAALRPATTDRDVAS